MRSAEKEHLYRPAAVIQRSPKELSATYKAGAAACPGVSKFITAAGSLLVSKAALVDIEVACDRANQNWPGPFGPVSGLPSGLLTQCHATGHYVDGVSEDITDSVNWSSSDPAVVNISNAADNKGLALTIAVGMANITAEIGGATGSLSFGVVGATLQKVSVFGPSPLPAGFTAQYTARGKYTLGTVSRFYDITTLAGWASTDPTRAMVSDDPADKGMVSTLAPTDDPLAIEAMYQGVMGVRMLTVLDVVLDSIDLTPANVTLALGQQVAFRADGIYVDGLGGVWTKDITHLVIWHTTDPTVASVDVTGLAFAHGLGDVAIVAELEAASGSAKLTVEDKCITHLNIHPAAFALPAGVPLMFQVIAHYTSGPPASATDQVQFKTSDAGRMNAPDATGYTWSKIGAAPGTVTIEAKALAGGCSGKPVVAAEVVVTPAALEAIQVVGSPPFVPVGLVTQYSAIGYYTDGTSFDITRTIENWESGNDLVAVADNTPLHEGEVTGVAQGTAPIVATQEAISSSGLVLVTAATLQAITVEGFNTRGKCRLMTKPSSWVLADWEHPRAGYTTWARAIGHFSDGSNVEITENVTWTSLNPDLALVANAPGNKGQITTADDGLATIRAVAPSGIEGELDLEVMDAGLDLLVLNPAGPDPIKLALGNQHQLELRGRFLGTFYCVTENAAYFSDAPGTATVSNGAGSRGRVDSHNLGNAILAAFIGPVNDTIQVQVGDPTLDALEIIPAEIDMLTGDTAQLRAFAHFSDGTSNEVTWNHATTWFTSNPASVDFMPAKGLVRANAVGAADIDVCMAGVCASHTDQGTLVEVFAP